MTRIKNARSRRPTEELDNLKSLFLTPRNYFGPSCNKHIFNPNYNKGNVPGLIN
jgi:hypothetical protein